MEGEFEYMNTWTLHVENFGKIKSANIDLAPMTLFVGDNNSGKSDIMTLIYGIMNTNFFGEQYQFDDKSENYKKCREFVDRIYEICNSSYNASRIIEITYEEMKCFENVLNELLAANKDRFVNNLFNRQTDIGTLNIIFHKNNRYKFLCGLSYTAEQIEKITITGIRKENDPIIGCTCQVEKRNGSYEYRQLISFIIEYLISESFGMQSVYFPAARTGYLMMYKLLTESKVKDAINFKIMHKKILTRPDINFFEKLNTVAKNGLTVDVSYINGSIQNAISIIEKNIIEGDILVSDIPGYDIFYQSNGTALQLPVFVTSSSVKEMVPLLLFLKSGMVQTMFIEEPEMCLHIKLHCEMARVLIRLVNSGIPIFAATHSDIILQHINNMIKLSDAAGCEKIRKKLGYEECDQIDKEKVAVYQFAVDESGITIVSKLSCGEFGYEVMTFYNVLEKLNRQIEMIERDIIL